MSKDGVLYLEVKKVRDNVRLEVERRLGLGFIILGEDGERDTCRKTRRKKRTSIVGHCPDRSKRRIVSYRCKESGGVLTRVDLLVSKLEGCLVDFYVASTVRIDTPWPHHVCRRLFKTVFKTLRRCQGHSIMGLIVVPVNYLEFCGLVYKGISLWLDIVGLNAISGG